jgi:hypothetical protein
MGRVYVKKPDAKREKVTVPVSVDLLERLKSYAAEVKTSYTEAARRFIEDGLGYTKVADTFNGEGKEHEKSSGNNRPV